MKPAEFNITPPGWDGPRIAQVDPNDSPVMQISSARLRQIAAVLVTARAIPVVGTVPVGRKTGETK